MTKIALAPSLKICNIKKKTRYFTWYSHQIKDILKFQFNMFHFFSVKTNQYSNVFSILMFVFFFNEKYLSDFYVIFINTSVRKKKVLSLQFFLYINTELFKFERSKQLRPFLAIQLFTSYIISKITICAKK